MVLRAVQALLMDASVQTQLILKEGGTQWDPNDLPVLVVEIDAGPGQMVGAGRVGPVEF